MDESNLVKVSTKSMPQKNIDASLTEAQKEIFLKYFKYDVRLASGNVNDSLSTLMVFELNQTNVTYSKDTWLRLMKLWIKFLKSKSVTYSPCDKTMKELLDDEFMSANPSTYQLSCILDHLDEQNSATVWKQISVALSSGSEQQSEDHWKSIFAAVKTRTILKARLLQSLQSNKIEITDDLRMNEIENRILEHEQSLNMNHENIANNCGDQCRVCLEYGNDFLNLFKDANETPSMIDKLLECSRISQLSEDDGYPQSICGNCIGQLEIAYQFRILSEISEHKLNNKITVIDDTNVVEVDLIEECDDGQSNYDNSQFDNQLEAPNGFEIWEETNEKSEITEQEVVLHQCETCGITFDTLKLLKKHKRCHVTAPTSSRECKLCSKVFKSEALLRAHRRTHSDLRPYICETCGKCFKTTSQLASHCVTHSDVKNFECPNCSYRGNTNNNLRIHLRTHTRVKPYSCRFCQWKFSTASNMQKHIRNIHHKMRTHQCNECDKSFFAKESLRKHMVTHTGIKLYSCSICAASYAWYNGLKKHMRIQHAGEKCPSEITFRPTKSMC